MNAHSKKRSKNSKKRQKIRIIIYNIIILLLLLIIAILSIGKISGNVLNNGGKSKENEAANALTDEELAAAQKVNAEQIYSYGETINIELDDEATATSISLFDIKTGQTSDQFPLSDNIDIGIGVESIDEGDYYFQTNEGSFVTYDDELNITFNTITRNGSSNPIILNTENNFVHLNKGSEQTENQEIDILIDAGHGGTDNGASSIDGTVFETDLNLAVAEIVADELSAKGYKVAITREDNSVPGGGCEENYDSYCPNGRVTMAYTDKAKLVISIHHNTLGTGYAGDKQGFEVFSSVYSSHALATLVANNLMDVSDISTRVDGYISDGVYTNTYQDEDDPNLIQDYMYMIRETGGIATRSTNDFNKPNNQKNQGSEAILIELGYLDNAEDLSHLSDASIQQAEAVAIADAVDEYIQSGATATSSVDSEVSSETNT